MQKSENLDAGRSSIEDGVEEFFRFSEVSVCRPGILLGLDDSDAEILTGILIRKLQPLLTDLRKEEIDHDPALVNFLEIVQSNDIAQAVKIGSATFQMNRESFFKAMTYVILACKKVTDEKSPEQLSSDLRRKVGRAIFWLIISASTLVSVHEYRALQKVNEEIKELERKKKEFDEENRQKQNLFDEAIKRMRKSNDSIDVEPFSF